MKTLLDELVKRIRTRGDLEREISHYGNPQTPGHNEKTLLALNYANVPDEKLLARADVSPDEATQIREFGEEIANRINH